MFLLFFLFDFFYSRVQNPHTGLVQKAQSFQPFVTPFFILLLSSVVWPTALETCIVVLLFSDCPFVCCSDIVFPFITCKYPIPLYSIRRVLV